MPHVFATLVADSNGTAASGSTTLGGVGVQYPTNAAGAASAFYLSSPASPTPRAVKIGAGRVVGFHLHNKGAAMRSVKLFNTAEGGTAMGTTAAMCEFNIPTGGVMQFAIEGGIGFSTAITVAVTGAAGLLDNTAAGLGDVVGTILYA